MHYGSICGRKIKFVMKGDTIMLKRLSALPILIFIVLIAPLQAFAQQPPQPAVPPQGYYGTGPWHHMWGDGYGWHFWWMFPLMMLCMIVIFAVIFFLARCFCGHGCHHWGPRSRMWGDPSHSALQILNERFARGEIQKDEYAEKKAAILSGG
jgi:putative membrane protein